ncbi:MAG: NUDIX hydrolase [Actinomycetota bacterium]
MADPTEPTESRSAFEGTVLRLAIEDWPGHPPYEVIHHPGAAAVLPILPSNEVLLVKQFRPPVRQTLTEIPAGLLDVEGEDALTCASRELFEETGYRHRAIEFLGGYYASPGFTDEYVHLFWARTDEEPAGEPEEGIEVVRMPFGRMVDAARAGRVRDVKTAVALLIAAARPPLP